MPYRYDGAGQPDYDGSEPDEEWTLAVNEDELTPEQEQAVSEVLAWFNAQSPVKGKALTIAPCDGGWYVEVGGPDIDTHGIVREDGGRIYVQDN